MGTDSDRETWFAHLGRLERRLEDQTLRVTSSISRVAAGTFRSAMPLGIGEKIERVKHVRDALELSGPLARQLISNQLHRISLEVIWPVLISMLRDLALIYGGSVVVGAGIGGAIGFLGFGVGAIPGAAAGATVGAEVGTWLLTVLGLASLLAYLSDALPKAFVDYKTGFRIAWGPDGNAQREQDQQIFGANHDVARAAARFADGHVIVLIALLAAIVAYLLRGKGNKVDNAELLSQIRRSPRLGPKVADWVEKNEAELVKEPALQPRVKQSGFRAASGAPGSDNAGTATRSPPRRSAQLKPSSGPVAARTSPAAMLKPPLDEGQLEPGAVPGDEVVATSNPMPVVPDGYPEISQAKVDTFSATPQAETLPQDTKLYRIIGQGNPPDGSFWTREMPTSEADWRSDAAVQGVWNGNGGYVEYVVPKGGLPAWTGTAASQNAALPGYVLEGGGDQVWIPPGSVTPSAPLPSPWSGN